MSEKEIVVSVKNLGKSYRIWRDPSARLKAPLLSALAKMAGPLYPKKKLESNTQTDGRVYNRNRYFQDFQAIKGVDLELRQGESIGIIGRNGSGKSTLLQMIAGTLTPTEGSVETKGRVAALLELGAGFNDEFTGRENVYMNGAILGLTSKQIDERFEKIVEFANIGEFIDQPIKTYSSGMRVRLAFAVQAEVNPDILIVDEALAVGDIRFTMKCIRRMKNLVENGTTLIFVSHDLGSIVNFCKEVVWINEGHVVRRGEPKEVTLEYSNYMHYGQMPQPSENEESSDASDVNSTQAVEVKSNNHHLRPGHDILNVTPKNLKWEDISKLPSDGDGKVKMLQASIFMPDKDESNSTFEGGESVSIFLHIKTFEKIDKPGFCADIYDLKGNLVFGINTDFAGSATSAMKADCDYIIRFSTTMPALRNGDYSILFGMSDGNYYDHTHVSGVSEALSFKIKSENLSQNHHIITIPGSVELL